MKKLLLFMSAILVVNMPVFALFSVGHSTKTFNDPNRTGGFGSGGGSGRQIQTEIYYPATSTGDNTPLATGSFPLIVFGHGFVMSWDAYQNIIDHYVPLGYVLAFPRTEGGISPSHSEFGLDLITVAQRMELESTSSTSNLFQFYNGKKAVMGHSMGGGASFLAAGNSNATFNIVVGLAPAETNPSAISAAASVSIPALIFSGTSDAVTPPQDHHIPIYNGLNSGCKHIVNITGGAHCYFANSNINCDLGEGASGGSISITRAVQQTTTYTSLDPYLEFHLKGVCPSWTVFTNTLQVGTGITSQTNCTYNLPTSPTLSLNGTILSIPATILSISWSLNGSNLNNETSINLNSSNYGNGTYTVTVTDNFGCNASSNLTVNPLSLSESWKNISIYPNPVHNNLMVSGLNPESQLALVDVQGKLVYNAKATEETIMIPMEKLKSGVYYLKIDGVVSHKLVKH